jgi:hypothetical protein
VGFNRREITEQIKSVRKIIVCTWIALSEARQAKRAATAAGRTVKLQTIAIELTEIAQKIDRMAPDIRFSSYPLILSPVIWTQDRPTPGPNREPDPKPKSWPTAK